jgi:hypothetical protein
MRASDDPEGSEDPEGEHRPEAVSGAPETSPGNGPRTVIVLAHSESGSSSATEDVSFNEVPPHENVEA